MAQKRLRKILLTVVALTGSAALLGETLLFVYCLSHLAGGQPGQSADLIAVFAGAPGRIARGIELARQEFAPNFIVSPTGPTQKAQYARLLAAAGCRVWPQPFAASTFEDAHYVAGTIREQGFRSVILVTSWWHVPRAYLLLRLQLFGGGVQVMVLPSSEVPGTMDALRDPDIWREAVKIWGSLAEWMLKDLGFVAMGDPVELDRIFSRPVREMCPA